MAEELKEKTARTARLNSLSILVVAGIASLWSAASGDWGSAAFGALLCVAAGTEFVGGRRLASDPRAAGQLLIGGELALLVLISGYAIWRLATFDFDIELAAMSPDARSMLLDMVGGDRALLRQTFAQAIHLTYAALLVVTVVYQGGMAWFYKRRVARLLAP